MNLPIDVDLIPKPNLPKNAKDYIEHTQVTSNHQKYCSGKHKNKPTKS